MSRRVTLAVILAVAVGLPVLGQPPPPEEFIQGLSSETTTDLADALAREGYRLLGEYEYEAAQQYSDYAVRANRVSFLGHWVVWRAQQLMAEEWSEDGDLDETIAGMLKQREDNPDDVVAIFNGAIADEHAGKVAPAADAYQKLLVDFPEQAVLHLRLGTVLSRLERYEESVDELEQALQLDAHLKEAFEPLAMGCLQLEHFDAAADAADKALEVAPDSVQLHHARAIIAAAQGQRTEAFGHVLEGNRIERSLPGLGHWLMSVWGVGATWGPVIALWVGTTIIAVLSLWMASRERPSTADIWLAGVNLLLVVGIFSPPAAERFGSFGPSGWTEAGMMYVWAAGVFVPVMIIDAVWDLIRGSPRGKESLLAGFSWTWAVVMFIEWLMTADTPYRPSLVPIIAIPIGLSVLLTRGQIIAHFATLIHRPARRHEKTIAWLRAAMRIDKSRQCRALAQVGIGDAYTQLGQYDEALRANEQALALDLRPTSGTAAANMSFLYTAMGRFEDATTMWQRAKQLCGSVSHAAIPDVCQAMLLVRQGQYEAGIAVARVALGKSLTPAQIKAAANAILGYGLAMMGDFQGATAACESACKTKQAKPWASIAETAMGIMWSTSGHWQEAAQHFAKAVELVEVGPEASLRAAQAYAMLGEWEKAEASLKAARDDAPLSQLAPIAADLLEHGRAAWHRTVLPMPRAPVYSQPPQGYSPPGHPHGQPPTY